ncbi:MAG TPA: hypothetical protein V6D33_14690 [Cyanophyceae cyanobacterium]
MSSQNCPKCGGELDTGRITNEYLLYISNRQTPPAKYGTPINQARACLTCGYVELYLDAEVLNNRIQK